MVPTILYILIFIGLSINLLITFAIGVFFWQVILHMVVVGVSMTAVGASFYQPSRKAFIGACITLVATFSSASFGILAPWTGSTELEAYLWLFGVVGTAALNIVIGLPMLIFAYILRGRAAASAKASPE